MRVRFGRWTKKYEGGIHFRIPYFDTVFIKSVRFRVADMGHQTITVAPNWTVTLTSCLGYRVHDIEPLYQKLHMADESIMLMVQGMITEFVQNSDPKSCTPTAINEYVTDNLDIEQYGLTDKMFKVVDYAVVKTYRLINEGFYAYSEHKLSTDNPE